jgi:hypothetical protein
MKNMMTDTLFFTEAPQDLSQKYKSNIAVSAVKVYAGLPRL